MTKQEIEQAAENHLAFMKHPHAYFERAIFIAGAEFVLERANGLLRQAEFVIRDNDELSAEGAKWIEALQDWRGDK